MYDSMGYASGGFSAFESILSLAFAVLAIVAMWKIFEKAGRPGWASLIPFYNTYVLFDIVYGNGIKFLLLLIPIYNIYVGIKLYVDLAKCYGKSTGFAVGLILVNFVFMLILGFDDSQYSGTVNGSVYQAPNQYQQNPYQPPYQNNNFDNSNVYQGYDPNNQNNNQ